MEFTDRYQALGIPYPNTETMCKGPCEGTGVYPLFISIRPPKPLEARISQDYLPKELEAWNECHSKCNILWRFISRIKYMELWYWKSLFESCDGWHFINCYECGGTGTRRPRI